MTTNSLNRTAPDSILSLRSPDAVIAAVPYLLGFQPSESLVILWLSRNQVLLTLRVDLPPAVYTGQHREISEVIAGAAKNAAADEVIICVFTDNARDGRLPFTSLITTLMVDFYRLGVRVRDALMIAGDVGADACETSAQWWSYLGDESDIESPGTALDEQVLLYVKSRFTLEGVVALPDRTDLQRAFDPDTNRSSRIELLVKDFVKALAKNLGEAKADDPSTAKAITTWRGESIDEIVTLVVAADGRELSDSEIARIVFCIVDIRVRDTLLWHLVQLSDRRAALDALAAALRAAPEGMIAPIATCTSICAWLTGDGARALVALERAQLADPDYSLAQLVSQGLGAGLPPAFWSAAMADVTEEQCRTGTSPVGFVTSSAEIHCD